MLYSLWQIITQVDWKKAGGDSFVQLWVGLNLAFFAWEKYQGALGWPRSRCEQIIRAISASLLDQSQIPIVLFLAECSKLAILVLDKFAAICRWSAGAAFLIGIYVLYGAKCGTWDWVLILPTAAYVCVSFGAFGINRIIGLFILPRTVKITNEISRADQATRN